MKDLPSWYDSPGLRARMDSRYSQEAVYQPIDKYCNSFGDASIDRHSGYDKHHPTDILLADRYEDMSEALHLPPNPVAAARHADDADIISRTNNPLDVFLAGMIEKSMIISDAQKPINIAERGPCVAQELSGKKSSRQHLHPQGLLEMQAFRIEIEELEFSWNSSGLVERKSGRILIECTTTGPVDFFSILDLVVSICSATNPGTANTAEAISIVDSVGPRAMEKRKREGDKDENEDEDGRRDSESRLETTKKRSREGIKGTGFACPFFKKDSVRFRICCNFTAKKISHVKQHLNRVHFKPSCFRCHVVFATDEQLNRHLMEAVACDVRLVTEFDWITIAQRDALSHRSNPRSTEEEQWFFIFDILFPGRPRPRSPYVEAGLSTEMSAFADFIRDRMALRLHERLLANPKAFDNNNLFSETQEIIGTIIAEFTARWATDSRGSNGTGSSLSSAQSANTVSTMVMPPERVAQEDPSCEKWGFTELTSTPLPTSPIMRLQNQDESATCSSKLEEPSTSTHTKTVLKNLGSNTRARRSESEPIQVGDENHDMDRLRKTESIDAGPKCTTITTTERSISEPAVLRLSNEDGMTKIGGSAEPGDVTKNGPLCSESGCNARFKTKKDLARHRNSKHQKSVLYQCPECSKDWTRKDNMVRHRRTVHGFTGIEPTTSEG